MKSVFIFVIVCLIGITAYCQRESFDFYGNSIMLNAISPQERDSIVTENAVPIALQQYINSKIKLYELEDWAIVLFLKKYVTAEFGNCSDADNVKILSSLLSAQNINNAIGIRNNHRIFPLISIDRKQMPQGVNVFNEDGYKLIFGAEKKIPFEIRAVNVVYYKGKDIQIRAVTPKLNANDYRQVTRTFFNYITKQIDSITFSYSPVYVKYSLDFPMIESGIVYNKLPLSPLFTSSVISSLSEKLQYCKSKEDSINFLMRFTQTVIKYEANEDTYGWDGYPCYPEQTLVIGKGDCDDYCMLLTFLMSYYLKDTEVSFMEYDSFGHVRLGIYDASLSTTNKSFVVYKGKKFLLAELTGESDLGDEVFKNDAYPDRIIQ